MTEHPVYAPQEDSQLLKCYIKMYLEEKQDAHVLDMGTGSGILAQEAARYANDVIAVDINPAAVEAVKKLHLPKVTARESDLFQHVPETFDLILFNAPYLPDDPYVKDIALDGGKDGHEVIRRFLKDAKRHLNEHGRILLLFSSLTNEKKIQQLIHQYNFQYKEIASAPYFMERLLIYEVSAQ